MTWLLHMKFMTLEQITAAFFRGCNRNRAPYRRLLKLMNAGLIKKTRVYIEPRDIYVLTGQGLQYLKGGGNRFAMSLPKDKTFPNYLHDKTLTDIRILFHQLDIRPWIPERVIRSIKRRGTAPDGLLLSIWDNYAIEYERTAKSTLRYKKIFERYAYKEKYDHVLYILNHDTQFVRDFVMHRYIDKKVYYIGLDELLQGRENATFHSWNNDLPVKELIRRNRGFDVEEAEDEELKSIIQTEPPDGWKDRKPFFSGGGGHKSKDDGGYIPEESEESSCDPAVYPTMYPNGNENQDSEESVS